MLQRVGRVVWVVVCALTFACSGASEKELSSAQSSAQELSLGAPLSGDSVAFATSVSYGNIVAVGALGTIGVLARTAFPSGTAAGVQTINLHTNSVPVLGRLTLAESPIAMRVTKRGAFVLTPTRLILVDVFKSPVEPRLLWSLPLPATASDLDVTGSIVAVLTSTGIVLVDTSATLTPLIRGSAPVTGSPRYIAAEAGRVYVGGADQLSVFDTQNLDAPQLLFSSTVSTPATRMLVRDHVVMAQTGAYYAESWDTSSGTEIGSNIERFNEPSSIVDWVMAGDDGAMLTLDGNLHRLSFGPLGKPVYRFAVPSGLSSPQSAHVAFSSDRALVASGLQFNVVNLAPPACALSGTAFSFTFDSAPSDRYPNRQPWTDAERSYLQRALGVVDGPLGQTCIGSGIADRLTRFIGLPDLYTMADGTQKLAVNFVKDPNFALAAGTGSASGQGATITLRVWGTLNQTNLPLATHELTHAFTNASFPTSTVLVTEGVAVAAEMGVSDDLYEDGEMTRQAAECENYNVSGVGMYHGWAWNSALLTHHYIASGCFFLRQQRAAAAQSLPNYFQGFRDLTRTIPVPTQSNAGATVEQSAIVAAAPNCIEDRPKSAWLAAQHVFEMDQPNPGLDVYVGPFVGLGTAGIGYAPSMEAIPYKREAPGPGSWVNEVTSDFDPAHQDQDQQLVDPSAYFGAHLTSGWTLKDEFGNVVGQPLRPFVVEVPWFNISPHLTPPNHDDAAELPPCSSDVDGDGEARCRTIRDGMLRVDYTDPVSGLPKTLERHAQTYFVHSSNFSSYIVGVTAGFNSGKVRVTFPLLNVAFPATVEGGVFFGDKSYSNTFYTSPIQEPACQLLPTERNACPVPNVFWLPGCQTTTAVTVTREQLRRYRGPVRVEQIIPFGLLQERLVNPKTFTKLADKLTIVY